MGSDLHMPAPPDGRPRYVAAFYRPEGEWKVAAEAPSREPVDRAAAEMIATVQARGEAPLVEIWGPSTDGNDWEHLDSHAPGPGAILSREAPAEARQRSAREERLLDRRHQVLNAALAGAGLAIAGPEDDAALTCLIEATDEETIRRLAGWLSQANR